MSQTIEMPLGPLESWTVRHVAESRLADSADRPFVKIVGGGSEAYGPFILRSAALAHALVAAGARTGHTFGILCGSGLPALHGWMAGALVGAIDVTINPTYRGDILRHLLNVTKPAVIMAEVELLPHLAEVADAVPQLSTLILVGEDSGVDRAAWPGVTILRYEDLVASPATALPACTVKMSDPAAVMFTSGTTGPSKGAVLPNAQICMNAQQGIVHARLTRDDVFYCAHPMNHIAGKHMAVLATFATGARIVLDRRFEASRWLDIIRCEGVTISIAHGPMIEMIHAQPPTPFDKDHGIRRLMCSPLPRAIGVAFEERFNLRGIEMWGMTETASPSWTPWPYDVERPQGSCGVVMADWYEMKIVDPDSDLDVPDGEIGEIVVRPKYPWLTMSGYMGMPNETMEAWRNLWFHTGDAGKRDEAGNFFMIDRIKDRIRRRAESISSYDIEGAALAFPGIREAAAVGVPSGMEGDDDVKLCVASNEPFEPLDLLRHLAGRLPHFMVPRYIETVDALPRTPTNKVRKRMLRDTGTVGDAIWDRHAAGIALRDLIAEVRQSS